MISEIIDIDPALYKQLRFTEALILELFEDIHTEAKWIVIHREAFWALRGSYNSNSHTWTFPWGAKIQLVVARSHNMEKLYGQSYSYYETHGYVSFDFEQFARLQTRIKLM